MTDHDTEEADLTGFIFEKLLPEEGSAVTPLTKRQMEEDAKAAKDREYTAMPLHDKIAYVHKLVNDPRGERLAEVKYEADPDTGKLVRKGNPVKERKDPLEIESGMALYNDYYESSTK